MSTIQRSKNPLLFFSKAETEAITRAIQDAEMRTSGEIRVHLEKKARPDFLAHGKEIFENIGMTKTQERNGVLILLCLKSRQFLILGDQGIDSRVPKNFWEDIATLMTEHFKKDEFALGIVEAVKKVGEKLSAYFPYQRNDLNELPDALSYSR